MYSSKDKFRIETRKLRTPNSNLLFPCYPAYKLHNMSDIPQIGHFVLVLLPHTGIGV